MKKLLLITAALIILAGCAAPADADVYVRGHYRSNGTYVQPHYRSDPDGNPYNNWSTKGNVNPYTGKRGTVTPQYPSAPSYNPFGSSSHSVFGDSSGSIFDY